MVYIVSEHIYEAVKLKIVIVLVIANSKTENYINIFCKNPPYSMQKKRMFSVFTIEIREIWNEIHKCAGVLPC